MGGIIQIPKFAQSAPTLNENCLGQDYNNGMNIVFPPPQEGGGKDAEVLPGFSILVTDLSDVDTDRFEVAYSAYVEVVVALVIVMKELTIIKTNPILSGTVIDAVECDWSYNAERDGDINLQSIVNTGAADPTLLASDRDYDYSAITIQTDETVTINGSDPNSDDSDVQPITFGNYIAIGISEPSLLFKDPVADRQAIFDALTTKTVKTTQQGHVFTPFGTATEYMVIAHPASQGESKFTKGSFTGGYKRIYWVDRGGQDIFVDEILGGDTPKDIDIDNGKNGFTENYFFYMSAFPGRTGNPDTIITKK